MVLNQLRQCGIGPADTASAHKIKPQIIECPGRIQ